MKTFMPELEEHQTKIARLAKCSRVIETAGELLINTLKQGGKVLLCGNGGSAADCQHSAADLLSVIVPSVVTARIQEAQIVIGHWWCGAIEERLSVSNNA